MAGASRTFALYRIMLSPLPPGWEHVLRGLPYFVLPPLAVYLCLVTLLDAYVSLWVVPLLYVSSVPAYFAFHIAAVRYGQARQAKAVGAVPIPVVKGRWPGNLDIMLGMIETFRSRYPLAIFDELAKQYGPTYNLNVLWQDSIFTVDPDVIKIILATDFPNFIKDPDFQAAANSVLGSGIFNTNGDLWKFHRNMTKPFFSRDRVIDFEIFGKHADIALNKIAERCRMNQAFDMQDLVSRFTLDSASDFLFGSCVNSLAAPLALPGGTGAGEVGNSFADAFSAAQNGIISRLRLGPLVWPLNELHRDITREPMKVISLFLEPIVKAAIERRATKEAKVDMDSQTLLDHLLENTGDMNIIQDELLNILLAGRDTTASTLTFSTYALAMYSNVFQKLRKEVLDTVGPTEAPTFEHVRNMKYLRAFINEVLRLFTAVPVNVRASINATIWPDGSGANKKPLYVPPKCTVNYSDFLMHRSPSLWGPGADVFDPERWLDDRLQKYVTPRPFIFLPFNAGPRICLGQQFAYNEVSFLIVKLLQRFESFALAPDAQPKGTLPPAEWRNASGRAAIEKIWIKQHITLYVEGGLWVTMKEVADNASVSYAALPDQE